jgi:hypothetical protein
MTDDQYAALAQKLGLASPSQLSSQASTPPDVPTPSQFAISNTPAGTSVSAGRDTLNRFPTDQAGSQGLSSAALTAVLAPDQTSLDSDSLNKAIDSSMQYHQQKAAQDQESLSKAVATLGSLDSSDDERTQAHATIQSIPTVYNRGQDRDVLLNPMVTKMPGSVLSTDPNFLSPDRYPDERLQRAAFVANITPADDASTAALKQENLNTGPSWRALQDLGLQFPGSTSKYATAPVFQSAAPPPAQKIERAQPVPGQTIGPDGKVVQAPASSTGLTTVRGTEFGQIDNPARGGYTEANWNVGAWGADISDTKTPLVALPVKVLGQYGNPGDADFAKNFNSKYEVQVTDPATGKVVVAGLGDKGPGASTGAGLDMTWATREGLGLKPGFSGNMSYRVVPKGSALPDNTTPSVQQQVQQTAAHDGQFTPDPTNPMQVFIKPLDPSTVKDPAIHGAGMSTSDVAQWARAQTDQYAQQMEEAGTPLRMDEYKAQYQKFFEGGQKYQNPEIKLEPVSAEHNQQFNALAALVSPNATPQGSQLDTLQKYWQAAQKRGFQLLPQDAWKSDEQKMLESQTEHLLTPIATGLMGMTPGDLRGGMTENIAKVLPNIWDSADQDNQKGTASQKLDNIRASVKDQMQRLIQINRAEHHDTAALEAQYRNIFANSPAATKAANQAKINQGYNKVIAQQGAAATQTPTPAPNPRQTPAQRSAAAEATAVKNPPPNF